MGVDLRAVVIRKFIDEGDLDGGRAFATEVLRKGDISDDLALALADLIEAKPKRGRPAIGNALDIAQTIREQLWDEDRIEAIKEGRDPGPQKSSYGDLQKAYHAAQDAHGCTLRQAEHVWAIYGEALDRNARSLAEDWRDFSELNKK